MRQSLRTQARVTKLPGGRAPGVVKICSEMLKALDREGLFMVDVTL